MIDFPYSETAGWFGIYFALIGFALVIVFLIVARLFSFRIMFRRLEPGWHPSFLLIIPITTIIGLTIALPEFWAVHKFRSFDLNDVGSLKIRETNEANGKVIEYDNKVEIRNLLRVMWNCSSVDHQHDELYDGYVLEVIQSDGTSANLFLTVYRKSSVKGSRKAVIAKYSTFETGEYDCPGIQNWVATNVDSLYGRPPVR